MGTMTREEKKDKKGVERGQGWEEDKEEKVKESEWWQYVIE